MDPALHRRPHRFCKAQILWKDKRVYLSTGFEPYKIYEVVYVAQDPQIIGLGLAAIRDAVSQLKYEGFTDLNVHEEDIDYA